MGDLPILKIRQKVKKVSYALLLYSDIQRPSKGEYSDIQGPSKGNTIPNAE
jgi:hypothetical protein